MRILILEDDSHRVNTFIEGLHRHDLTITECSYDAIDHLEHTVFDYLYLDHDLGTGNGMGTDVTSYLRQHPENLNNSAKIVIHSWNIPAASNMLKDLPQAHWAAFNTEEFFSFLHGAGSKK